jgi:hypothetical protein
MVHALTVLVVIRVNVLLVLNVVALRLVVKVGYILINVQVFSNVCVQPNRIAIRRFMIKLYEVSG